MNASLRPRVTVIIPVIQALTPLKYALESVLWQTFANFEVWVISDKSDDRIEEVINRFGDSRFLWQDFPEKSDSSLLFSEGIRRARGEYIAYLHPNDLWLPNHLQVLVDALDNNDYDVAFTILQSVSENKKVKADIPLMPDLDLLPETTVLIQRKNILDEFRTAINPRSLNWFDVNMFFEWGKRENIKIGMVPMTTGVKFLSTEGGFEEALQLTYIDRLRKDPDFINKELSALLISAEYAMHSLPGRKIIFNILKVPVHKMLLKLKWDSAKLFFWQSRSFRLHRRDKQENPKVSVVPGNHTLMNRPDIRLNSESEEMVV